MKNDINNIYPNVAKIEYDAIEINGLYTVGLLITEYPPKIDFLDVIESLPRNIENRCSVYVFKQDENKILKDLTTVISVANSEKKTVSSNQVDVDILKSTEDKAKELRRKIQIENEGVYRICIYISVWDKVKQRAIEKAKTLQNVLYTKAIILKVGNFRQKELYLSNLPINYLDDYLKKITYKTFTTTGLAYLFPFYNKYIIEKGGVQFGITNKSICIINMFSKNSTNANMLVIGSSGSGKSYFAHILIIRGAINGIFQKVIDPEGEYEHLAEELGGTKVNENINLMYFSEKYVNKNKNKYLENKIESIIEILNLNKIFTSQEEQILEKHIRKAYYLKKINENEESLYLIEDENGIYINKKYISSLNFPTLQDAIELIPNKKTMLNISTKIKKIIKAETIESKNIIKENNIVVYSLKQIPESKRETYIKIFLENIKEGLENENKTQIYIDELWKCIGYGKSENIIYDIADMFKSIRKKNAGIIAITQDISDLFKYEKGGFAKSILNNSYYKAYFKMEYTDVEILENVGIYKKNEIEKIKRLSKGKALITKGWTSFQIDIVSFEKEKTYIEKGEDKIEENSSSD